MSTQKTWVVNTLTHKLFISMNFARSFTLFTNDIK